MLLIQLIKVLKLMEQNTNRSVMPLESKETANIETTTPINPRCETR